MSVRRLHREEARQLAIRAQRLDATRPTDLVDLVDQLTLLQVDPTAAIAPSADLVAWSRLGASYRPADLTRALEEDRTLFELRAFVRPMTALPFHVPEETRYTAQSGVGVWLEANDRFRRDVLARLRDAGPLLSRDVPDTSQVPWGSTGWTNNRNVTQMLELLSARGEVAVAGRVERQRLWDVADRVYPKFEPLSPTRPGSAARNGDSGRSGSPEPPRLPFPASRSRSGTPASRRPSREWRGSGAWTRTRSTNPSSAARRCCHRSTA